MSDTQQPESEPKDSVVEEAMRLMQLAIGTLKPEERQVLSELRREIDAAARGAPTEFDKRLEFCYAIKFSKDKIPSARLQDAVNKYIQAVEG